MGTPGTDAHKHGQLAAIKGTKTKPEEKQQQVKCLLCKNGDLSSDPQSHTSARQTWQPNFDVSTQEVETDPKSKSTSSPSQTGTVQSSVGRSCLTVNMEGH